MSKTCPRFCTNCPLTCVLYINDPFSGIVNGFKLFTCLRMDDENAVGELLESSCFSANHLFVYDYGLKMFVNIRISNYVPKHLVVKYKEHISSKYRKILQSWKFRVSNREFDGMLSQNMSKCQYYAEQLVQSLNN